MQYNLTSDANLDELLSVALASAVQFNIDSWIRRAIASQEVNKVFNPSHIDDTIGLAMVGTVSVEMPDTNMDIIYHAPNADLITYLANIKALQPTAQFSSTHVMDADGFMAWHTNKGQSPTLPHRLYVTHNAVEGSIFKYIASGSGVVTTINEPIGWYAKVFDVETEFLHCIKSGGLRHSIGIRF